MGSAVSRRSPRGEGAQLRGRLIDAAVAVIDESGDLAQVTVRAITRRAGVSPTALYLHFADREELVDTAIDAGFAAFNAAILEAAGHASGPRARLLAMGVAYLAFSERQPALYSVIFGTRPKDRLAAPRPGAVDRRAAFDALVAAVAAARGSAEGAEEIAVALWSALHGFAELRARGGPATFPPGERFARRLLDAWVPG